MKHSFLIYGLACTLLACGDVNNEYRMYYDDDGGLLSNNPISLDAGGNAPDPQDAEKEADAGAPTKQIEISAGNTISIDELRDLPRETPGFIRTDIGEKTATGEPMLTDLRVELLSIIPSPLTGDASDPYLQMQTAADDSLWEQGPGVAHGESGSPFVLLDGRLAGALSFSEGGRNKSPYPFIATPIRRMEDGVDVSGKSASLGLST
ncbi:MAG: hypothetical protein Q7S48_05060 [bacterium]|nr:hypothetical protein [bacterium]